MLWNKNEEKDSGSNTQPEGVEIAPDELADCSTFFFSVLHAWLTRMSGMKK